MKVHVGGSQEKKQREHFGKTVSRTHFWLIAAILLLLDIGIVNIQVEFARKGAEREIADTARRAKEYIDEKLGRYLSVLKICGTDMEAALSDGQAAGVIQSVWEEFPDARGIFRLSDKGEGVVYQADGGTALAGSLFSKEEQQSLLQEKKAGLRYYALPEEGPAYVLFVPSGGDKQAVTGVILSGLELLLENGGGYLCGTALDWEGIYEKETGTVLFEKDERGSHIGATIYDLDDLGIAKEEMRDLLNTDGLGNFRDNSRKNYYIYVQDAEEWGYVHISVWRKGEIGKAYFKKQRVGIFLLLWINVLLLASEQIWHSRAYQQRIYRKLKKQLISDSILRHVLDSQKIFLLCLNGRYEVEEASEGLVEELCGLPMEEVIGSNLFFLLKLPKLKEFIQEYQESGEVAKSTVMSFYGRKERKRGWYFIEIQHLVDGDGELHYLMTFLAATDLLVAERVIHSIMQNTQDFMLILDEQHNVQYISGEALKRLQVKDREEVMGRPSKELPALWMNGRDLEEIISEVTRFHSFDATVHVESAHNRETGDWWATANAFALNRENESYGIMLILKDITAFLQKTEETEKANKVKENLLYTVSHGVKTPLNALLGSTDILLSNIRRSAEEEVYLQNIKQAVKELVGMLDEVLDFTKLDSDELALQESDFDIMEMVDSLAAEAFYEAKEKNLAYYTEISADIPATVYGDAEWLRKALSNLLQIFIALTKEGFVKLIISCGEDRYEEKYLHFELQGTGDRKKQFGKGRFFRQKAETGISYDSTEILCEFKYYVCGDVVRLLGSELEDGQKDERIFYAAFDLPLKTSADKNIVNVSEFAGRSAAFLTDDADLRRHCETLAGELLLTVKEPEAADYLITDGKREYAETVKRNGKGCVVITEKEEAEREGYEAVLQRPFTVVSFTRALHFEKPEAKKERQEENPIRNISAVVGIRALVVDDNEINRMITANMLKLLGAEADMATDGVEAVERAKEAEYDLILMDHLMPNMDGVRATKVIRGLGGHNAACLIFALTADLMDRVSRMFAEAGATEALAKPLELKTLKEKLAYWLPADRLVFETEEEAAQGEEIKAETAVVSPELKEVLALCPELNIEKGLSYLQGNEEQYCKVLTATVRSLEECLEKLSAAPEDEKNVRIVAHSMKGMFFGIGAESLAQEAAVLERAAADGKKEPIEKGLPAFTRKSADLAKRLDEIFQEQETEEETVTVSEEAYAQAYDAAVGGLKMFDIDVAIRALKLLVAASRGEVRERMKEAYRLAEDFDYDGALSVLEENQPIE